VEVLARHPYAYRTSFPLDEAQVRLPGGEEATVLVKELDRSGLDERARRAKPAFVHDPQREIVVYTEILAAHSLGTARCYGVAGCALFLEKVEGVELWQRGDLEAWEDAARWAARLHREVGVPSLPQLLRYDAAYFRQWLGRAEQFRGRPALEAAGRSHEEALERLAALPVAFVHGELYPSNVLVAPARICPVDWEMAGVGAGVLDLAALVTGWSDDEVRRLVAAYAAVAGAPVHEADLDAARLVLAVQWLGWADQWSPPREHATDWLAEANAAAGRLAS
jgi:thiamine kinase-like enzyme